MRVKTNMGTVDVPGQPVVEFTPAGVVARYGERQVVIFPSATDATVCPTPDRADLLELLLQELRAARSGRSLSYMAASNLRAIKRELSKFDATRGTWTS